MAFASNDLVISRGTEDRFRSSGRLGGSGVWKTLPDADMGCTILVQEEVLWLGYGYGGVGDSNVGETESSEAMPILLSRGRWGVWQREAEERSR